MRPLGQTRLSAGAVAVSAVLAAAACSPAPTYVARHEPAPAPTTTTLAPETVEQICERFAVLKTVLIDPRWQPAVDDVVAALRAGDTAALEQARDHFVEVVETGAPRLADARSNLMDIVPQYVADALRVIQDHAELTDTETTAVVLESTSFEEFEDRWSSGEFLDGHILMGRADAVERVDRYMIKTCGEGY